MPDDLIQISETKHGFLMKLNLENKEHQRIYFYGEHDERYEIKLLQKIIQSGDICYDIGANIGFYSLYFDTLSKQKGKTICFEPASTAYEYLQANIKLNNRNSTVTEYKIGVGKDSKKERIYYPTHGTAAGTASIKYQNHDFKSEVITIDSIDSLMDKLNIPVPDFVKIDVEGYQQEVLEGGVKLFGQHAPIIMAELKDIEDKNDPDLDHIQALIQDLGYLIFEIKKGYLKKCERVKYAKRRNFLLVKDNSEKFSRIEPLIS